MVADSHHAWQMVSPCGECFLDFPHQGTPTGTLKLSCRGTMQRVTRSRRSLTSWLYNSIWLRETADHLRLLRGEKQWDSSNRTLRIPPLQSQDWSAARKSWCCRNHQRGCNRFDCHLHFRQGMYWGVRGLCLDDANFLGTPRVSTRILQRVCVLV
jgi:hypothetical protein